jgi:hypothetical protein
MKWFKGLRSYDVPDPAMEAAKERLSNITILGISSTRRSEKEIMEGQHKKTVKNLTERNTTLEKALATALSERKTMSRHDFKAQLEKVINAATAHSNSSGLPNVTAEILYNSYCDEWSRIFFLAFESLDDLSEIELADKVSAYLKTVPKHEKGDGVLL